MASHLQQFQNIQSMLVAGHRSVHLERHSLLLLGAVGGFLIVVTEWIITVDRFPDITRRGLALLVWLAFWFSAVSFLDYRLTHRARQQREETLPFAQAQITRAWWMLLTVGCLGSTAMVFYGGGAMVYALWTILLGLGIYLFGLFSRPLIEWIGLATILLGAAAPAAGLPYGATRWLAASCFAIGLPLAGWLNGRVNPEKLPIRAAILLLWLVLVVSPALLLARYPATPVPGATAMPQGAPELTQGEQVLRLEAGSQVSLRVDMEGELLGISPQDGLTMVLRQPVEVALADGEPDGRYRVGEGPWHTVRDGILRLQIDRLSPRLEEGRPVVRAHARVSTLDSSDTDVNGEMK